jgi:hypothetical protein
MRFTPHAYLTTSSYALSIGASDATFGVSQIDTAATVTAGTNPQGDGYRQIVTTSATNSYSRVYTTALSGFATGDYTLTVEIDVVTASPVIARILAGDRLTYVTLPQGQHVVNTPFHYLSGTSNEQIGLSFSNLFSGATVQFCTFRIYSGRVEQSTPYTVAIGTGAPTGGGPWRIGDQVINATGAAVAGIAGWFNTVTGSPGTWLAMPAVSANPYLLAVTQYAPATLAHYTTTSTTLTAMDATNLTITFTAPVSGNVLITLSANVASSTSTSVQTFWGLTDHTVPTTLYGYQAGAATATTLTYVTAKLYITGLASGTSYHMDWALASSTASDTVNTYAQGITGLTAATSHASPAVMTVEAL